MRVLVITYRGEQHHATETDEYSSRGNPFIVCNCGATAYGLRGITIAHNRGKDQLYPVTIVPEPEKPTGARRIWNPDWSTRQEKREHLSRALDRKDRPLWWAHKVEQALCRWYGHTPSADPKTCVYCQRRRSGSRVRDGRWNPQPAPEPAIGPRPTPVRYRFPPPSTVHGPRPIPPPAPKAIEHWTRHRVEHHPDVPAGSCPICMGPPPEMWRPAPPCQAHHRTNCPYCMRRSNG